jgi:hypothetical protein
VADSTCAAEFVAASVCAKQLTYFENMFRFLGFTCPKPYVLYTDSQASQSIATIAVKMGKIRHIAIRYHLIRQMVARGEIQFSFFFTEDMIADLMTKSYLAQPLIVWRCSFIFLAPTLSFNPWHFLHVFWVLMDIFGTSCTSFGS